VGRNHALGKGKRWKRGEKSERLLTPRCGSFLVSILDRLRGAKVKRCTFIDVLA